MNTRFLADRARPFFKELAVISSMSVLSACAALAVPWLAGRFLGGVLSGASAQAGTGAANNPAASLGVTIALLVAALVCLTAINIIVALLSQKAAGKILAGLQNETYARIQAMPLAFHDRSRTGDLLSLMAFEVGNLSTFLTATLANVPAMLMTAGGAVVLLFVIDPAMALVVPILVGLFYIVMKLAGRRLRLISRKVRKAEAALFAAAESDLSMLAAIKAFAVEEFRRERFATTVERARVLHLGQARMAAVIGPVVALAAALAAIAILLLGSADVVAGRRSPGDLFTFLLYAALLTRPVAALSDTYSRFQIARGTLARLEAVFAMHTEPGYAGTRIIERARGAIAFEQVSFAYPGRGPVLQALDLAVAPGEIVALTGENGVGKSTIVRLLLRFYDPTSGRITLDGTDIATLQVQSLRRQFGYVPQRPLLFNGTIAQNIAFGMTAANGAAIERASRMAQAWDFIQALPRGLETQIGDNGVRLSGGQQQRIALARALLRDPPVYIFDEATSMYDLEGEAAFVESCIETLKGRTVIIITHRPASLALAHRVIRIAPPGGQNA